MGIHGAIFYPVRTRESIIDDWHLFSSRYRLFYKMVCTSQQKSPGGEFQKHHENELAGGNMYKYFIPYLINLEVA